MAIIVHEPDTQHARPVHAHRMHGGEVHAAPDPVLNTHEQDTHEQDTHAPASPWGTRPHARRTLTAAVVGKGGSAKSSSVACLGDALEHLTGWSTVLVDLDAQPSLTEHLAPGAVHTLVEVLLGEAQLADVAVELRAGLRLLPAHDGLADLDPDELNVPALVAVLADLDEDGGRASVALLDSPAWQPVTSSSTLLATVMHLADVLVIPFALGRKGVRAMASTLADLDALADAADQPRPVLLLPANVDRPVEVEAAVELARALRPDLTFAAPVPHVATAMRRAEDRGRLLRKDSPRSPAVAAYADAAEVLAHTLLAVGARS